MRRRPRLLGSVVIALSALVLPVPALASAPSEAGQVQAQLAGVRMPFIANQGQVDARVAYYAPTFAGTLFVTQQGEIAYALSGPRTDAKRDRGRSSSKPGWSLTETLRGGRARPGGSSFLGHDPAHWRGAVPTWEQVSLGEVWPGSDWRSGSGPFGPSRSRCITGRVTSPSPKLPTDVAEGAKQ